MLGGSAASPQVLERSRIQMIDDRAPESKQPYHAVESLPVDEAGRRLERYMAAAAGMAWTALQTLATQLAARGYQLASAGVLESSGRKVDSLASILGSHALIHGADGDHFRNALATAATRGDFAVTRLRARDLEKEAVSCLRLPPEELQATLGTLGRALGPPWGADQKAAALLAWMLLKRSGATKRNESTKA